MKSIYITLTLFISPILYANEINNNDVYTANSGQKLSTTLINWSLKNDFSVLWNVKSESGDTMDWEITHPVQIEASYYEAVSTLLRAYRKTNNKIKFNWTFYKNKVLEIHLEESL